ncbi:hypothetical protein C5S30_05170 [ANME-1 cluster archaeon GoMg4]|nr:hypothetical protein [ANME-1 cluster archaeon GoMg4]
MGGIKNGHVKKIEWIDVVIQELIRECIFNIIVDMLVLAIKRSIRQLADIYRWNKISHVCPILDKCEKEGESINGSVVLSVDSYGRISCGGCLERFAYRDEKEELKKIIQLEAKAQGDEEISDEEADEFAEKTIKNREMFYKIKKIKTPVILMKKILKRLKWKLEEQRSKHFVMGCKSCGAMWISDFEDDTCPNCCESEYTYPTRPGGMDIDFDGLNEICTASQLEPSVKKDSSLHRIWSTDSEHEGSRWSILISALLEPNKKDIRFASGNIALNGDVCCSKFFTSKNDVTEFISDFKQYYSARARR